jgi:hypothetical protein
MVYAVYSEQMKSHDFGSVQFITASEYKSKHKEGGGMNKQTSPPPNGEKGKRDRSNGDKKKDDVLVMGGGIEESNMKTERSKALALDEKVSRKLNNIISRIHDHQPITTKNSNLQNKENQDQFKLEDLNRENNTLLSSTTSISSCLFNKNLSSTLQHSNNANST